MATVYVQQTRNGKAKWYRGTILGSREFTRRRNNFIAPDTFWIEQKLLIRLSNGQRVEAWESETYRSPLKVGGGKVRR